MQGAAHPQRWECMQGFPPCPCSPRAHPLGRTMLPALAPAFGLQGDDMLRRRLCILACSDSLSAVGSGFLFVNNIRDGWLSSASKCLPQRGRWCIPICCSLAPTSQMSLKDHRWAGMSYTAHSSWPNRTHTRGNQGSCLGIPDLKVSGPRGCNVPALNRAWGQPVSPY